MSEPNDDRIETGTPIGELKLLAEAPEHDLVERVRRGVNRRMFSAELVRYSWFVPFLVAFEYLKVLIEMVAPGTKGEERKQ